MLTHDDILTIGDRCINQRAKMSTHPKFVELTADVVRPFLVQSEWSVENGLFRLKPKSGFLTQSQKGFFDSTFSTVNSDWRIQSKNSVEKSFTRVF